MHTARFSGSGRSTQLEADPLETEPLEVDPPVGRQTPVKTLPCN